MNDKLLSTQEASELSGYVPNYIRELCRSGKVKSTLVGFSVMVHKDSLLEYMKKHKNGDETVASPKSKEVQHVEQ